MQDLKQIHNPFVTKIVEDPWKSQAVDVPEIHAKAFERCLAAVEEVRRSGRTQSVLIHGEAGTGKTHLLSRLRRAIHKQRPDPWADFAVFVWLKLQVTPDRLWQYLRRHLVEDLLRPYGWGLCQLQWLVISRIAELRIAEGDLDLWRDWIHEYHSETLAELVDRLCEICDLDYNVSTVLRHFVFKRMRRLAGQWLRGEILPEKRLEELDLPAEINLDREQEARSVVLALCRLAGQPAPHSHSPQPGGGPKARHPIVICFDQVEALQRTSCDIEAMFLFGQLVSTLHADTRNLVLITCVQSAFLDLMKQHVRQADYDRMGEFATETLNPLPWNLGKKLLAARLDSVPGLQAPRRERDELWPLEEQSLRDALGPLDVSARRLIEIAAVQFAQTQTGQAPQRVPVERFLEERYEQLIELGLSVAPEDSENVIAQGLPLLAAILAPDWKLESAPLQDVDLRLVRDERTVDVSYCFHQHMTSLAARLRRLSHTWQSAAQHRLVLVRPADMPISPNATATRNYLETLTQRGAVLLHPSHEVMAGLDALRKLLSDAKAGDLSHNGESVSPQAVEQWLRQNLSASVQSFVSTVFPSEPEAQEDRGLLERLTELVSREHVVALKEAARRLGVPEDELWRTAQSHPDCVGISVGPPAMLFQFVGSTRFEAAPKASCNPERNL